jgi:hypothetical protein
MKIIAPVRPTMVSIDVKSMGQVVTARFTESH